MASSSSWVPRSAMTPSSTTATSAADCTVDSRCAMTMTVRPACHALQRLLHQRLALRVQRARGLPQATNPGITETPSSLAYTGNVQRLLRQ